MFSVDSHSPFDFVDFLKGVRHIVMFHEDEEYATKLRFRFLQKGILNEELCVYVTPETPTFVEERMKKFGIDVEVSKERGLLKIIQARDDFARAEDVTRREDLLDEILGKSTSKRIVLDEVPSMGEAGIRNVMELERYAHTTMVSDHESSPNDHGAQRLLLCSYSVKEIEPARHAAWMSDLLKLHDSVVFAPRSSEGIGFVMR